MSSTSRSDLSEPPEPFKLGWRTGRGQLSRTSSTSVGVGGGLDRGANHQPLNSTQPLFVLLIVQANEQRQHWPRPRPGPDQDQDQDPDQDSRLNSIWANLCFLSLPVPFRQLQHQDKLCHLVSYQHRQPLAYHISFRSPITGPCLFIACLHSAICSNVALAHIPIPSR